MKKTIIICDFINEIIHEEGKFKGKGYADFAKRNNILANTAEAVRLAREQGYHIIFVKVGFSKDYSEQPKLSPLFGKADEYQALQLDTWATEIVDKLKVEDKDTIITKHRVSPFYNTSLDAILKDNEIEDIYLCGCATDLVISSAVRDAHDRDYNTFVLQDCCAAGSESDHTNALIALKKIATIGNYEDLISQ